MIQPLLLLVLVFFQNYFVVNLKIIGQVVRNKQHGNFPLNPFTVSAISVACSII